jgi:hypothetical protein
MINDPWVFILMTLQLEIEPRVLAQEVNLDSNYNLF